MKGADKLNTIEEEARRYDEMNDVIYDLLCELDRVCQMYDVKYYLAYGTLIGAVRDHGLIRWDDDVDVFIANQELQKLIAHKDAFGKGFQLVVPEDYGEDRYYDSVVRLNCLYAKAKKESEENTYYHNLRSYVSLDLFRISPVPSGIRGWAYGVYMCSLYAMANAFRYHNSTEHYSSWMKAANAVLLPIGRRVGLKRIRSKIQNGLSRFEGKAYREIHHNDCTVRAMFTLYEKKDFERRSLMKIREKSFPVPVGYDRVLKKFYGDYMIPSPEKDRGWKFVDVDAFEIRRI